MSYNKIKRISLTVKEWYVIMAALTMHREHVREKKNYCSKYPDMAQTIDDRVEEMNTVVKKIETILFKE